MSRAPTMTRAELERLGLVVDTARGVARKRRREEAGPRSAPRTPPIAAKPEHLEQAEFVGWVDALTGRHPHWAMRFAVPNFFGHAGEAGARIQAAKKANAEGRKKGMCDLGFPFARGRYHGLYIEMKRRDGGKLDQEQRETIARLRGEGYAVAVCLGADAAKAVLQCYEALGPFRADGPAWQVSDLPDVR